MGFASGNMLLYMSLYVTTQSSDVKQKAVILWTQDPPERDAKLAKDALKEKKKGIKHLGVIVEIACASSPHHLMAVRQAYCSLFDCSLEEDITSAVDMPLRKVKQPQVIYIRCKHWTKW